MYRIANHIRYVSDGDVGVVFDVRSGKLFGLNGTSDVLLGLIAEESCAGYQQLHSAVEKRFQCRHDEATRLLDSFLTQMTMKNVLARMTSDGFTALQKKATSCGSALKKPMGVPFASANYELTTELTQKPRTTDVLCAVALLSLTKVLVRYNFGLLYRLLQATSPSQKAGFPQGVIDRLLKTIAVACKIVPHQAMCIERSATLALLLRLRGVPACFCMGCRTAPFYGHAWVEVQGRSLNERSDLAGFFKTLDVV